MNLANYLKKNANKLPVGLRVGALISKVDYSLRPGIATSYRQSRNEINDFNSSNEVVKNLIFKNIKNITNFALENTKFYREFYGDNNFSLNSLRCFDDICKIPIVTKSDLRSYSLDDISCMERSDLQLSNTGGSTGKPFNFYVTAEAMGHEWAHVHHIWRKLGFSPSDLKAIFAGRSNVRNFVQYDLIRHSLSIDIYSDFELVAQRLIKYSLIQDIKYLHGYPSAIFEFALYCESNPRLLDILKKSLRGAFLTSEYPHRHFRDKIESVFDIKTQSFYGHTERCIIAYENLKEEFVPLQSYGYCEVEGDELIGTSYKNYGTPLIRYNTGDKVKNYNLEDGLVSSFFLEEGRAGEFIIDAYGKKIPLTGLVFGRHHLIFNYVSHIQIYQKEKGRVLVLYKPNVTLPNPVEELFDFSNVNITFDFLEVKNPIKTLSGKFKLLVDELPE